LNGETNQFPFALHHKTVKLLPQTAEAKTRSHIVHISTDQTGSRLVSRILTQAGHVGKLLSKSSLILMNLSQTIHNRNLTDIWFFANQSLHSFPITLYILLLWLLQEKILSF